MMLRALILFSVMFVTAFHANAGGCTKTGEVCIDNATRVINGFAVTRCWNYQSTYSCPSENYEDYCAAIATVPGCVQINSTCIETGKDGQCDRYQNTYRCGDQITPTDDVIFLDSEYTIVTDKLDMEACATPEENPDCHLISQECIEGEEARVINGLEVHKSCWKWDYTYACKSEVQYSNCEGLEENCSYQSKSCYSTDDDGNCLSYERAYQCEVETGEVTPTSMVCEGQTYCINGDCETTEYQADTGLSKGLAYMNLLKEAGDDFNADTFQIFTGAGHSCDKAVAGFNNCCQDDGWGQDLNLAMCSIAEQELAVKARNGQCHYIGSYCSNETFFGVCLEKRKSYCCFNSKLARILHEQARGQVSMSWGTPEAPQCSGMTVEQLESIDFEQVDLSELYPDIQGNISLPSDASIVEDLSDKIEGYYAQ